MMNMKPLLNEIHGDARWILRSAGMDLISASAIFDLVINDEPNRTSARVFVDHSINRVEAGLGALRRLHEMLQDADPRAKCVVCGSETERNTTTTCPNHRPNGC